MAAHRGLRLSRLATPSPLPWPAWSAAQPRRSAGTLALAFPGQGAQRPGMGADLYRSFPAARAVFEEVDEALQQRLSFLMFEGQPDDVNATVNAQPALLAHGIAVLRVLQAECGDLLHPLSVVLGHSVGEYGALVAADALPLAAAARLLRVRALAMQAAADSAFMGDDAGAHAMYALLLRVDPAKPHDVAPSDDPSDEPPARVLAAIRAACAAAVAEAAGGGAARLAELAAVNSTSQVVLSGHAGPVSAAVAALRASGVVRKAVRLPVSAPFHCAVMLPAAAALRAAIVPPIGVAEEGNDERAVVTRLAAPRVPLVSNVTAALERDPGALRELLAAGITAPVRWAACARVALSTDGGGATTLLELGPGSTLAALVRLQRSLVAPAAVRCVGTVDDVRRLVRDGSAWASEASKPTTPPAASATARVP